MLLMVVTLDVSNLSSWLNADAACRAERRGHAMGGGDTHAACMGGKARLKAVGAGARAERTWNMPAMVVTLDVSKLSGWLNALASCRVDRRACDAGKTCGSKSVRALGSGNATGMHGEGPTQGCA